jgi:hypothetical protein
VLLAAAGLATARRDSWHRLHTALVVGTLGGLLGTFAYDLFRLPFQVFGYRLLAPIDSYGVLIAGAASSGPWTGLLGWIFHFSNGIGFGVTYAVIALGRRWQWGLPWGLAIETLAVASPVAGLYALRGVVLIAIAYGGHLAYGTVLGQLVSDPQRTLRQLREVSPHTLTYALIAVFVGLVIWQRPSLTGRPDEYASAVVRGGRFQPEWTRVADHGCVELRNADTAPYVVTAAVGAPRLEPGQITRACFGPAPAVVRVRLSDKPYSGGFVIVDRAQG